MTNAKSHEQVTVEDFADRKVIHVQSGNGPLWDLAQWKQDTTGEPRVSVADLAKRVDQQAFKLRQTARGLVDENFKPFEDPTQRVGYGNTSSPELHLNEAEALYLCTKLRTKPAKALTWEMIRVYMLARRGLLPQQQAPSVDMDALADAVARRLDPAIRDVQAAIPPSDVLNPRFRRATIAHKIQQCVALAVRVDPNRSAKSYTTTFYNWLRGATGFGVTGCRWDGAPLDTFMHAVAALDGMISLLAKMTNGRVGRSDTRQGVLFDMATKKKIV
jgi:hypothetical protein